MFQSRTFLTYFGINVIEIIITWTLWFLNRTTLPDQVPFNFLAQWGNDQLVASADLWQLPLAMTAGLVLSTILAWFFWKKERVYGQFLIASLGFINFIALLSFIHLIIHFT